MAIVVFTINGMSFRWVPIIRGPLGLDLDFLVFMARTLHGVAYVLR